ncbi:hypothetical protein, unlikely [Trypanosoma brucei gambiense DAL972]|uniref:Uncharacterized protein n=1 Tax=Trypanosoma brucei gambiense (strain MHOM/CI/86/DAL972) TaxID=679716 RepID=C9ZV76_TRYB9|nr:hypothetical protein, unlikely [Trypanosoma brucei gambiense DAL972]CBH13314.1 hypothetical protein, unlikely [Trypanosoma brucei gambiense DAL972]|eukprot:XP_011775591.1 hypothetical protein, unlikely [Trypanosoma brucei gambiense DAL972]
MLPYPAAPFRLLCRRINVCVCSSPCVPHRGSLIISDFLLTFVRGMLCALVPQGGSAGWFRCVLKVRMMCDMSVGATLCVRVPGCDSYGFHCVADQNVSSV